MVEIAWPLCSLTTGGITFLSSLMGRGVAPSFLGASMTHASASQRNIKNRTASKRQQLSRKEFQRELRQIAGHWGSHDKADLALRHRTGTLLNRFHGDPTQRQARGESVMKEAAKVLRKTEAELSQLRWFAFRFKSL